MFKFSFMAITQLPNKAFQVKSLTISSELANKGEAIFNCIHQRPEYHDCLIIDCETKAPITFDSTVKLKGANYEESGFVYPSDVHAFTMRQYNELMSKYEQDPNLHEFLNNHKARIHYSQAGKAGDMFGRSVDGFAASDNWYDGSPFFDSQLHFEKIKDRIVRDSHGNVSIN